MKVYFIGAGPGAPDLITLRGINMIAKSQMVMYAGSLVSTEILGHAKQGAEIIDTSALNLEEQMVAYQKAKENDWDVARIHSGDPSIYGATAEQMRRLNTMGISYQTVPGVPSFVASAALLNAELTKPTISQTIILTRTSGRASKVPELEELSLLASHQATLCIFLSAPYLPKIVDELKKHYPMTTPIALVQKATWPQEQVLKSTLENILDQIKLQDWTLSTMILVGEVLGDELIEESKLYSKHYTHKFRIADKKDQIKKGKTAVKRTAL